MAYAASRSQAQVIHYTRSFVVHHHNCSGWEIGHSYRSKGLRVSVRDSTLNNKMHGSQCDSNVAAVSETAL